MNTHTKIESNIDAWDDGTYAENESTAKLSDLQINDVQEAAGLKTISIRIRESLIDDLKLIASIEGIGYQPLMKQVLQRFVDCELKDYARKAMAARSSKQDAHEELCEPPKKRA